MSSSPDLGICRLCFASEAANFDRTFKTIELDTVFYSFAGIEIPRHQDVPQKICGHCEKNIEGAKVLRSIIRFSTRVWAKFTKAEGKDEKVLKEDLEVSLNCHMCGQCFNYGDLLAHITNDHGADHLSDCDLCQVLANQIPDGVESETTLLLDSTVYEEVIEEINEEILAAPLPDDEEDVKGDFEDDNDPDYDQGVDDEEDDDDDDDGEEVEEEAVDDDDNEDSVKMDESSMVRSIINEEGIRVRRYHCPTCDQSYARTDKLRNHMKNLHNLRLEKKSLTPKSNVKPSEPAPHTCNWCGLSFSELSKLDTHLLLHDRQKPFCCTTCNRTFLNRAALVSHSTTEHKNFAKESRESERKFQCRYCERRYGRMEQLRRHVEKGHPEVDIKVAMAGYESARFECPICDASYTRIEKLDVHMLTHDDKPFFCDRCDMAFKSRGEMRNHGVCSGEVVKVKCDICPLTFNSVRLRDLHSELAHDTRVFSCPDCGREFDTRHRLVSHKRTVHEKMFECPICHKTLSRQDKLDYHMRQHNGFPCPECSVLFATRREWREHLASVHNSREAEENETAASGSAESGEVNKIAKVPRPKPFRCDMCYTSYTTQQKLDVHIRDGHSVDGYSCEHCDMKFESRAKLKVHAYKHNQKLCGICGVWISSSFASHVRRHQGIKPHKCLVEGCGKEFLRNCDLTSHTKTHTGEKPFPCDICGMRFSRPYKVTVHKRTHTGVRPYKCDFENCKRDFAQSFDLTLHMRRHTGEKPYSCDRCGEGFILTSILKKHQQNCTAIMIMVAEEEATKMETQ